jgi:mannose-6-phosphate isomerase-like protein (cupin superfamily)
MRAVLTAALISTVALVPLSAQAPAPQAMKLFAASSDIQAMIAKAKAERKPDQANFIQPIVSLPPYTMNLEYRALVGPAAVHEKEPEVFYVVDGAGTLVTGGKLTEERRTNAENLTGTGIAGGESRRVAKGDVIVVPENTPHWFSKVDGTLVLMSLHLKSTKP